MSFFGLGSGGLKINIELIGTPESHPNDIIYLHHRPGWKVRKNVFATMKRIHSADTAAGGASGGLPVGSGVGPGVGSVVGSVVGTAAAGEKPIVAYSSDHDVEGVVRLQMPPGKKIDHLGIQVRFFGRIELESGAHEGRPNYDFISLTKELLPPGPLYDHRIIPFHFRGVEKMHESYHGRNVSVKYFVRVDVVRQWLPPITSEHEVLVQIRTRPPVINDPIKMEVGIEDCLHIEFEYERRCYHLHDVISGRINFLLVRIKIKHMELAVIRRETSGEGVALSVAGTPGYSTGGGGGIPPGANPSSSSSNDKHNILTETQTLLKYEIMDGAPVKGELIPVKLHLRGIPADVTPTYHAENNRFSVRYFLNLVLVDEEDRRYFKQQEIILWRKELG